MWTVSAIRVLLVCRLQNPVCNAADTKTRTHVIPVSTPYRCSPGERHSSSSIRARDVFRACQAPLHFVDCNFRPFESGLRFRRIGFIGLVWVAESPRVLGESLSLRHSRPQQVVDGDALTAQVTEIVCFSKRAVVKRQERFERLPPPPVGSGTTPPRSRPPQSAVLRLASRAGHGPAMPVSPHTATGRES